MAAPVIAIDGPAGSGKTTVALALARRMNYHVLPSGMFYRSVAFLAKKNGIAKDNLAALAACASAMRLEFVLTANSLKVFLNGGECDDTLYDEEVGALASSLSTLPELRAALVAGQRSLRALPGLVAEGRDMGSVIFPDARWKFFLTAGVDERAERRLEQLNESGARVSLGTVRDAMAERDERDAERASAPMRREPTAIVVDTTGLSAEQTVMSLADFIETK